MADAGALEFLRKNAKEKEAPEPGRIQLHQRDPRTPPADTSVKPTQVPDLPTLKKLQEELKLLEGYKLKDVEVAPPGTELKFTDGAPEGHAVQEALKAIGALWEAPLSTQPATMGGSVYAPIIAGWDAFTRTIMTPIVGLAAGIRGAFEEAGDAKEGKRWEKRIFGVIEQVGMGSMGVLGQGFGTSYADALARQVQYAATVTKATAKALESSKIPDSIKQQIRPIIERAQKQATENLNSDKLGTPAVIPSVDGSAGFSDDMLIGDDIYTTQTLSPNIEGMNLVRPTEEHLARRTAIFDEVIAIVKQMTGGIVDDVVIKDLLMFGDNPASGAYTSKSVRGDPLIAVALAGSEGWFSNDVIIKTARHELLHFAEEFLFVGKYKDDATILRNLAPVWREDFDIDIRYKNDYLNFSKNSREEALFEEGIAEAFGHLRDNKFKREFTVRGKRIVIPEAAALAFERIAEFLDRIAGIARNKFGYRNYKDVFRDLESGKLAKARIAFEKQQMQKRGFTEVSPDEKAMVVYHGSPHDFEGPPSTEFIGTGEGAQAYGWGFYAADAEGVGKSYRGPGIIKYNGKDVGEYAESLDAAISEIVKISQDRKISLDEAKSFLIDDLRREIGELPSGEPRDFRTQILASAIHTDISLIDAKQGKLYKLDLPWAEEDYLYWDRALSEQSPKVKAALEKLGIVSDTEKLANLLGQKGKYTGKDIYENLVYKLSLRSNDLGHGDFAKAASEALLKAGIPGIRFLDQMSRDKPFRLVDPTGKTISGFNTRAEAEAALKFHTLDVTIKEGTYNYVIFDPSSIKVLEKSARASIEKASKGNAPASTNFDLKTLGYDIGKELTEKRLLEVMGDLSLATKIPWDRTKQPLIDHIIEMLGSDKISNSEKAAILESRGFEFSDLQEIMKASGLLREDVKWDARRMAQLSHLSRQHRQLRYEALNHPDPAVRKEAAEEYRLIAQAKKNIDKSSRFMSYLRSLDQTGRGLLVMLPDTVLRNTLMTAVRVGMESVVSLVDVAVQRAMKGMKLLDSEAELTSPREALTAYGFMFRPLWYAGRAVMYGIDKGDGEITRSALAGLRKNKIVLDDILQFGGFAGDLLFERYSSDVLRTFIDSKDPIAVGLGKLNTGAYMLNVLNRTSEFWARRFEMLKYLEDHFHRKGSSLQEQLDYINAAPAEVTIYAKRYTDGDKVKRKWQEISDEEALKLSEKEKKYLKVMSGREFRGLQTFNKYLIRDAINDALDLTYAQYPKGIVGSSIARMIHHVPPLSIIQPFPIYMVNAIKHVVEFSPLGFAKFGWKMFNEKERAKVRAGDTKLLSRAITGTGFLYLMMQIENDQPTNQEWHEYDFGDGKKVSWLGYGPWITAAKLTANIVRRYQEGRMIEFPAKDVAQTLLGLGYRNVDVGISGVNDMLNDMLGLSASEGASFGRAAEKLAGDYLARYTSPLRFLQDMYATVSSEEAKVRTTAQDPFWGPTMRQIPGLSQELPELEDPTKEETPTDISPMFPHFTGMRKVEERNPLQEALIEQGFQWDEIFPGTGDPELNQLYKHYQGRVSSLPAVQNFIESEFFKGLSNRGKGYILDLLVKGIRQASRELMMVPGELTQDQLKKVLADKEKDKLNKRAEKFIEDEMGITVNELLERLGL